MPKPAYRAVARCTADCRFWQKVIKHPDNSQANPTTPLSLGCWEWTAATSKITGIGQVNVAAGKATIPANKYAYKAAGLNLPDKHRLDPICGMRTCVRPEHQKAVLRGTPMPVDAKEEKMTIAASKLLMKKW